MCKIAEMRRAMLIPTPLAVICPANPEYMEPSETSGVETLGDALLGAGKGGCCWVSVVAECPGTGASEDPFVELGLPVSLGWVSVDGGFIGVDEVCEADGVAVVEGGAGKTDVNGGAGVPADPDVSGGVFVVSGLSGVLVGVVSV